MSAELYEVLSMAMRYWFVLLGVLIVLRSFAWLLHDRRVRRRRLHRLPDAGTVGELLVLHGSEQLPEGAVIALPYEGTLGFVRTADVVVPCPGVAARHLDLSFQPGVGMLVSPYPGLDCLVDGAPMSAHSQPRLTPLYHNSVLTVGEAELKVRLFAGVDAQRYAARREDDAPDEPLDSGDTLTDADEPEAASPFGPPSAAAQPEEAERYQRRRRRHGPWSNKPEDEA